MPIQSQDAPPILISKITPHMHIISHNAHLHYRAISQFTTKWVLQGRCSVLGKNHADDVHKGGEGFLDAPCSLIWDIHHSSNKAEQQLHNYYYVLKYSP